MSLGADEIIVVDGNSTDGTYEFVKESFLHVRCIKAPYANRAFQMNLGVNEAVSDVLIFLHADVSLPEHGIDYIKEKIIQGFSGGCFLKKYEPNNIVLSVYGALLNQVYTRLFKNFVGSNGIFITRDLFIHLKGFPQVEFLEDVLFAHSMKRVGWLAVIDRPVVVSSRRYLKRGVWNQMIRNGCVMFNHFILHKNPKELKKIYTVNCYEC